MLQSQFSAYPATQAPLGVQSVVPQVGVQSVAVPTAYTGVQSVVPGVQSVVPGVQSVVPGVQSVVPGVQSVVPAVQSVVPGVQSVVPVQSMVPVQSVVPQYASVVPQVPVTPYIQPIGSRHPIEQNHLGLNLTPGTFSTLGGSPYGKISTVIPATSVATPSLATPWISRFNWSSQG